MVLNFELVKQVALNIWFEGGILPVAAYKQSLQYYLWKHYDCGIGEALFTNTVKKG